MVESYRGKMSEWRGGIAGKLLVVAIAVTPASRMRALSTSHALGKTRTLGPAMQMGGTDYLPQPGWLRWSSLA